MPERPVHRVVAVELPPGVDGLGAQDHLARMYLPALGAHPGFEVVARVTDVAGALAVEADLVCVVVPLDQRVPVLTELLRADRAVLADKPLAGTAAGCRELAAVSEQTGSLLVPAHHHRFGAALRPVLDAVRGGRVGLSRHAQVDFLVAGGAVPPIGDLLNLAVHPLDVLHTVLPPLRRVHAVQVGTERGAGAGRDGADLVVLHGDHDHGVTSTVLTGRGAAVADTGPATLLRHRYRFVGSHGVLHADAGRPAVTVRTPTRAGRRPAGPDAMATMLDAVAAGLSGVRTALPTALPTATEAADVLEVVEAAGRSLATGVPVDVG